MPHTQYNEGLGRPRKALPSAAATASDITTGAQTPKDLPRPPLTDTNGLRPIWAGHIRTLLADVQVARVMPVTPGSGTSQGRSVGIAAKSAAHACKSKSL